MQRSIIPPSEDEIILKGN